MKQQNKKYLFWAFELLCITTIGLLSLNYSIPYLSLGGYSIPLFIIPLLLILIFKFNEFNLAQSEKVLCVKSQLESQLGILYTLLQYEPKDHVRCTIHVPKDDKYYCQITDYYPTRTGASRKFRIDKGIVGKSIAGRLGFVEKFKSTQEYQEKSKKVYNFTDEELFNLMPERRSFFCYPIGNQSTGKFLGVIYFDSANPDTFKCKDEEVKKTSPYDVDELDSKYQQVLSVNEQIKTKLEEYIGLK